MSKIFRLQNNVPNIYVEESRDFQTLCNVFDIMNSGIKYDIDSMPNILDTNLCRDSMIPLLQSKLGFFTKRTLTTKEIRHVLCAFKRLVKDKGSRIGIKEAIEIYLKLLNTNGGYRITITNNETLERTLSGTANTVYNKTSNVYLIEIDLQSQIQNTDVLKEMLNYVLPAGYKLTFGFYTSQNFNSDVVLDTDSINIVFISTEDNNSVFDVPDNPEDFNTSDDGRSQVGTTHTFREDMKNETSSYSE